MQGRSDRRVVDRSLLRRAFGVLGACEAVMALVCFAAVLVSGGWSWGEEADPTLLAVASGSAFAAIACGQMANAFACRSSVTPVWRMRLFGNPLVVAAVAAEAALLLVFLGVPPVADLLGGGWPNGLGWALALAAAPAVILVDGMSKAIRSP